MEEAFYGGSFAQGGVTPHLLAKKPKRITVPRREKTHRKKQQPTDEERSPKGEQRGWVSGWGAPSNWGSNWKQLKRSSADEGRAMYNSLIMTNVWKMRLDTKGRPGSARNPASYFPTAKFWKKAFKNGSQNMTIGGGLKKAVKIDV